MRHLARIAAFVSLFLAVACAPRGVIDIVPEAARLGRVHTVFVATTRAVEADGQFGAGRSPVVHYARYDISVPPSHRLGHIEWPHGTPDPRRDFVTTRADRFANSRGFARALHRALRARPADQREVVVFVHGFNNNFAEGLYRMAQLMNDFALPGVAVHYSWPSAGNPLGYGYDRDSMLFARDGLDRLLRVIKQAGGRRVLLVGHSMGALLVMEALRQTALEGQGDLRARLRGVVLISPDIDIDLFRQQAARIGRLPQPFVIFTSRRDRALRLSAGLTGQKERLGSVSDVRALANLHVTLFDVSQFSEGVTGHFVPATSPALIKILAHLQKFSAAFANGRPARPGLIPGTVLTVQNATQIILSPVRALSGG